jgi:DNA-binding MarR family transcriptional regulator
MPDRAKSHPVENGNTVQRHPTDPLKARRRRPASSEQVNPDIVRAIERSILQIVRNMGRRSLGRSTERRLDGLVDFTHVAVVDAIADCTATEATATVGQVGKRIGVDPSRASRMVAKAIRAGYAKRTISQEDGRRSCVILTKKGEEFRAAIEELRGRYFATHLKALSQAECETFADLLAKFLQAGHGHQSVESDADSQLLTAGTVVPLRGAKPGAMRPGNRRRRA